jgi:hypothetical protein
MQMLPKNHEEGSREEAWKQRESRAPNLMGFPLRDDWKHQSDPYRYHDIGLKIPVAKEIKFFTR